MGWNPFRKSAKAECAEEKQPVPAPRKRKRSRLPEYDDREDTQRIVTTLAEYRASKQEGAEELEETAEAIQVETKRMSHTLSSMPAIEIPAHIIAQAQAAKVAEEEPAE